MAHLNPWQMPREHTVRMECPLGLACRATGVNQNRWLLSPRIDHLHITRRQIIGQQCLSQAAEHLSAVRIRHNKR